MAGQVIINKFATLYEKIPKYPEIWNSDDIETWLQIIGMEKYSSNFKEMGVDGYLILELVEEEIEQELQITIKLHRKKIMKAIEVLKEYTIYLKENFSQNESNSKALIQEQRIVKEGLDLNKQISSDDSLNYEATDIRNEGPKIKEDKTQNQQNQKKIIIKSIEGPNDMNFTISQQGMQIGRHSTNQIVIFDESVSRYHADIFFKNENFYLRDIGSTTGTFIKITKPIELVEDIILEIGSYQLIVSHIHIENEGNPEEIQKNSFVEFTIYESPEDMNERVFKLHSGDSIGRKTNNFVCFSDDLHMSNLHCKINLIGNKFKFEDIASTNGSWLRLSRESEESEPKILENETIFKIGNSAMYEVFDPQKKDISEDKTNSNERKQDSCSICWNNERDCLILPCRHNVTCTKCIKAVKNCPICRTPIHDIILIYKSQVIIQSKISFNFLFPPSYSFNPKKSRRSYLKPTI